MCHQQHNIHTRCKIHVPGRKELLLRNPDGQAGILANKLLTERLATKGFKPCHHTPGFWKHKWPPVWLSLVVDDFGVKYIRKQHAIHLVEKLKEWYKVSEDWDGTRYCGITIKWDYINKTVDLSMPGYITNMLHKFQHEQLDNLQHSPHQHVIPNYGAKV
eukprot:9570942-Ditylum_brightwellii.AAC.1